MRSNLLKKIGISGAVLSGLVLAASLATIRAQADSWDKMTLLTVDQPTQISDTYLEPGTYMFKLANSDRHIVQIFNKDRSRLINTIIAIPSYRVYPTGDTQISYWETPPGTARAVRTWYYPGDYDGQEFRYPKNLRQIAAVTPPTFAPKPPPVESEVTPAPAAAEPPAPEAPEALEQAPPAEQPPVEIAQNNAPPEPAPQAEQAPVEIAQNIPPAPPPPNQAEEQTLPKTASPYPLIGLGGLFALGLYAVLRIKRIA
jgi:hypothetical protein